jgi:tetrahydromethanopterin S-methyltransferase subunit C
MAQYTDGRYGTRQTASMGVVGSNAAANSEIARFQFFTQVLIKEVRACVVKAGTSHATHAYKIYKGDSSIGQVTFGTNALGSVVDASLADTTFAATDSLILKHTNSDQTAQNLVYIDYQEDFSVSD